MRGGGGSAMSSIELQAEEKILSMLNFLTHSVIKDSKILPFFCFTSLLKSLQNSVTKVYYIDTLDIQGETNIFKTMQKIASILNIPFDKKLDDFKINYSSISLLDAFFPYTTEIICKNQKIEVEFFTDIKNKNSKFVLPTSHLLTLGNFDVFLGYFHEDDAKILQNNHATIIEKFDFISEQIHQLEAFVKNGGIENLIIKTLKNNSSIQKHLKEFLEYEVSSIQQNAPQIVESWAYYQKFLQD